MVEESPNQPNPRERAKNLIDDAASLRELGIPESELASFMLERVGIDHPITAETLPPKILRDVDDVAKNTHPN